MPLNSKGKSILRSMERTYGDRAKNVFYASINSGKIKGVESKADGGAVSRLPDHYAEIGSAQIEDRRDHDPTLRAMGVEMLKKRAKMRHANAMMDSQRTETEFVDRLVPRGYADGGVMNSPYPQFGQPMAGGGTPWETKAESRGMVPRSGFLSGITGGRTDAVPMGVKRSSYVIPADVVSGLGGGNSQAGAHALGSMFAGAPFGAKVPAIKGGKTAKMIRQKFADGGMSDMEPPAEIMASHGEYVLSPQQLIEKFGDIDKAHDVLDAFVSHVRKKTIKTLKRLPRPKKS